jgi:hypothetical protein
MNPWIWRIFVILMAIALLPVIVSGTASLITTGIQEAGKSINYLFEPLIRPGNARLKGMIELGLYLIAGTLLARVLFGRRGGGD